MRPRGMPPMPSARSRAMLPVGMVSMARPGGAAAHDGSGAKLLVDLRSDEIQGFAFVGGQRRDHGWLLSRRADEDPGRRGGVVAGWGGTHIITVVPSDGSTAK